MHRIHFVVFHCFAGLVLEVVIFVTDVFSGMIDTHMISILSQRGVFLFGVTR